MLKPCYRIIALDETNGYSDEFQDKFKTIYGIYLYNSQEITHLCELLPSYVLHYIDSISFGGSVTEQDEQDLIDANIDSYDVKYVHCSEIDKIYSEIIIDLNDEDVDDRFLELSNDELLSEVLEYCHENNFVTEEFLKHE